MSQRSSLKLPVTGRSTCLAFVTPLALLFLLLPALCLVAVWTRSTSQPRHCPRRGVCGPNCPLQLWTACLSTFIPKSEPLSLAVLPGCSLLCAVPVRAQSRTLLRSSGPPLPALLPASGTSLNAVVQGTSPVVFCELLLPGLHRLASESLRELCRSSPLMTPVGRPLLLVPHGAKATLTQLPLVFFRQSCEPLSS